MELIQIGSCKNFLQLALMPEIWGGDIPMVQISALKGKNVDELLETVMLVAEVSAGLECGIGMDGFTDWEVGDFIEAFNAVNKTSDSRRSICNGYCCISQSWWCWDVKSAKAALGEVILSKLLTIANDTEDFPYTAESCPESCPPLLHSCTTSYISQIIDPSTFLGLLLFALYYCGVHNVSGVSFLFPCTQN